MLQSTDAVPLIAPHELMAHASLTCCSTFIKVVDVYKIRLLALQIDCAICQWLGMTDIDIASTASPPAAGTDDPISATAAQRQESQ